MARAIDSSWDNFLLNLSYLTLKDFQENRAGLNTLKTAVVSQPTLTPQNEPLTLEQLREMDGEPVFVVIDDGIEPLKMWALVDYIAEEQCLTLTNNLGGRSQYYTADDLEIDHITVYRRPPEGEGNA